MDHRRVELGQAVAAVAGAAVEQAIAIDVALLASSASQ